MTAGESDPIGIKPPACGDVVVLRSRVPAEYHLAAAIVTETKATHCTVIVLDESHSYGAGESWPSFKDLEPVSQDWRLGSRLVVSGLQSKKTQHLNGAVATVISHPRHGHPCFIQKNSAPGRPVLTLCVRFDDRKSAGMSSVLLEPRFLVPWSVPSPCSEAAPMTPSETPQETPRIDEVSSSRVDTVPDCASLRPHVPRFRCDRTGWGIRGVGGSLRARKYHVQQGTASFVRSRALAIERTALLKALPLSLLDLVKIDVTEQSCDSSRTTEVPEEACDKLSESAEFLIIHSRSTDQTISYL
ncbi:unnamed protein product [Polarella glacialis]|uniref:Uncharacterized protein n=1 Tax=Polarella glacialis TaxID=89957 RepID=A0A813EXL9_POLGL|nr:unnamed protein product [Polarella glacialis]CAE8605086.1 unnamed protein product [Polarella glacialis]CAE8677311.1 unnamed protein product [Polarella glacialis]|mmetsp:Transcript_40213/g.72849  ORF Transcript_40213/g.72849 Transcript_40213/m.72849 type:complete len:301 (+) Transcript_40213:55-957(+)|eukprot:CAMPEP_0115106758 /NCGR_PEP_ID=MMETSP0227-20121206/36869_1 /TAXON_ID=89957 /ORGANISM="Polarella glacialis, Strain CCMP 1383" /LENGTH=300 /DNA_ID=CAMNT_0002504463 /DNA_START=57 /DNA_END=959 /DNA_ORIENTATION=+